MDISPEAIFQRMIVEGKGRYCFVSFVHMVNLTTTAISRILLMLQVVVLV